MLTNPPLERQHLFVYSTLVPFILWKRPKIRLKHCNKLCTINQILDILNLNFLKIKFEFMKLWTITRVRKQSSHPHCCLTKLSLDPWAWRQRPSYFVVWVSTKITTSLILVMEKSLWVYPCVLTCVCVCICEWNGGYITHFIPCPIF